MSEQELNKEIAVVEHLIAEEAQDLVELTEELVDLEAHAQHGGPVPHGRRYRIKVDGEYHVVDAPTITGAEILRLAHREGPLVFEVVQHFRGGREEIISADTDVNLRTHGVERFTTQPKLVQVTVDSRAHTVQAGSYLVANFKRLVGVEASKVLDQVIGGEFRELADNQTIQIVGGEIFVSHVRQGQSS